MEQEKKMEVKETPEQLKTEICEKALWLKNDFYADPNDWIGPNDYVVERGEAEKKVHKKRKNKFLKGWFSLIQGFILSENGIKELPADDPDRIEIEKETASLWSQIRAEIKRTDEAEIQVVKETLCGSEDFRQMVKDFDLTVVSKPGNFSANDKDYLYHCISHNNMRAAFDHLWPLETVQIKFEFSEDRFKQWLAEHFGGWVNKYFELKKKYRAISPETVQVGDQILNIVIERLNKNKTQV